MPLTIGILNLVVGVPILLFGIILLAHGVEPLAWWASRDYSPGSITGVVLITFATIAITGGVFALRKRARRLALAGLICALFATLFLTFVFWPALVASFAGCSTNGAIGLQRATPLANTSAYECNPVWSPDGGKIFFQQDYPGESYKSYICVMNSDGSNVQKLAEGRNFILSPDGSKILFLFAPQGYSGELNACWWLMESDGSNRKKLPPLNNPSFNPDGSKICYYTFHPTGYYWVQRESGVNWTRLDHEPTPEEGEFICYAMEELADIWVMDIAGGSKTKIASNIPATLLSNIPPTFFAVAVSEWSPDGEKILFQTLELYDHTANFDIWTMNEDGSNKKRLTDYTRNDLAPRWSPDGKKIAYVSGGLNKYSYEIWGRYSYSCEIWVMNPDGGGKRKLTRNAKVKPWFDWSPDGRKIAYVSTDIDRALGLKHNKSEIWVMKADGSNKKLLLRIAANGGNMDIHQIKWKPDSSEIAFGIRDFSGSPGDHDIYLIDVPGS